MGGAKRWGESGGPLESLAKETGASPYQLVLAWHLNQREYIIPIPGASITTSIEDSAKAATLTLDSGTLETLRQALKD